MALLTNVKTLEWCFDIFLFLAVENIVRKRVLSLRRATIVLQSLENKRDEKSRKVCRDVCHVDL